MTSRCLTLVSLTDFVVLCCHGDVALGGPVSQTSGVLVQNSWTANRKDSERVPVRDVGSSALLPGEEPARRHGDALRGTLPPPSGGCKDVLAGSGKRVQQRLGQVWGAAGAGVRRRHRLYSAGPQPDL